MKFSCNKVDLDKADYNYLEKVFELRFLQLKIFQMQVNFKILTRKFGTHFGCSVSLAKNLLINLEKKLLVN